MAEIDYQLSKMVRDLSVEVSRVGGSVESVSGQVRQVDSAQQRTESELMQLIAEFREFVSKADMTANRQFAVTRLGNLQDELDHKFRHYGTVRRTATGILQAFDVGLVSEDVVRQITEELMLQTPGYWLAPALVALAAWSDDNQSLYERAIEEASRRSPDRTALLFALILRRQGRHAGSVRWLRHYLMAQDPTGLGREFPVILECISQGAFGPAGRTLLRERLDGWQQILVTDEQVRLAQVSRWFAAIEGLRGPVSTAYPRLAKISPQWPQLDGALRSAGVHQALLDKYEDLMAYQAQPSDRLEDTVDDILDQLVSEYDNEELPLRRDIAFNNAVLAHDGDKEAAKKVTDADASSLAESSDYLTVQSTTALDPDSVGASRATQQLSVAACREWFSQAHAGFSRDYRAAVPSSVEVTSSRPDLVGNGNKTFRMAPWRGSFNTPQDQLERSLVAHWDHSTKAYIESLAYDPTKPLVGLGCTVFAIFLLFVGVNVGFAFIAAVVVGGVWGLMIHNRVETSRNGQKAAEAVIDRLKKEAVADLRGAAVELTDWQKHYQEADAVSARVRQFIASLATATTAAAPFEGRVVTEGGASA
ncbi:hypothetical protein OG900_10565 [Streptomyces sp. NBC_00433]